MRYLIVLWCLVLWGYHATAQAGHQDPSFSSSGVILTNTGPMQAGGHKLLVQPDGKIIAYGWITIAPVNQILIVIRYLPDGTIDTTFGVGGRFEYMNGDNTSNAFTTEASAALQADNKILLSTSVIDSNNDYKFAVYRLKPDGTLDSAFGNNGIATADHLNQYDESSGVIVQPDGHILQAGYTRINFQSVMLAKYRPDGNLDSSFANNGIASFGDTCTDIIGMGMQPGTGKIMIFNNLPPYALRFDSDGHIDTTYHHQRANVLQSGMQIRSCALQADGGTIFCLDSQYHGYSSILKLHRLTRDGFADSIFPTAARLELTSRFRNFATRVVKVQPDNKILIGGSSNQSANDTSFSPGAITVLRFDERGQLDSSFGDNGIYFLDTSLIQNQRLNSIAIQNDGKILLLGEGATNIERGFVMIRLLNDLNVGLINADNGASPIMVYPNPISGSTSISYELLHATNTAIALYTLDGKKVQVIRDQFYQQSGQQTEHISIDEGISAGTYILAIESPDTRSAVMVTIK